MLRGYLAERDVLGERAGSKLRCGAAVVCREGGTVIPRTPSEALSRAAMDPAALKLWCPACDYEVTGVNTERCPECGGPELVRFTVKPPKPKRGLLMPPRGVP